MHRRTTEPLHTKHAGCLQKHIQKSLYLVQQAKTLVTPHKSVPVTSRKKEKMCQDPHKRFVWAMLSFTRHSSHLHTHTHTHTHIPSLTFCLCPCAEAWCDCVLYAQEREQVRRRERERGRGWESEWERERKEEGNLPDCGLQAGSSLEERELANQHCSAQPVSSSADHSKRTARKGGEKRPAFHTQINCC